MLSVRLAIGQHRQDSGLAGPGNVALSSAMRSCWNPIPKNVPDNFACILVSLVLLRRIVGFPPHLETCGFELWKPLTM
jgi:hypothetical protein